MSAADIGSIPAWAGETGGGGGGRGRSWVYPRVGGGNWYSRLCATDTRGLSPRGRGKPWAAAWAAAWAGSIPAWAGETSRHRNFFVVMSVYPRVGGGNRVRSGYTMSPDGLSPRGRGKHRSVRHAQAEVGSIPAWAGETPGGSYATRPGRVYPRVGGGNDAIAPDIQPVAGLSPRGRGKHAGGRGAALYRGSIPAWAGETACLGDGLGASRVYPRVGGGNHAAPGCYVLSNGLSPRGRGKRDIDCRACGKTRSIPAWAGETDDLMVPGKPCAVYPRVGGGNR